VVVSAGLAVAVSAVVVSLGAAVVAAAVGSVEVSAAAVVVVSPPPLARLNTEPIPLQPLHEQPVMEIAVITAMAAQPILSIFGFFFNIILPHRIRSSSYRSGITAVYANAIARHVVDILEANITAEFAVIYVVDRFLSGLGFA